MRRVKSKAQHHPANVSLRKAKSSPSLSLSFKQSPAVKAAAEILKQADYHRRIISGIKRSLVTAGFALILLVVLYFFLA